MANKNLARTHRARGWKQAVCVQGLEQTSPSRCSFMPPHCTLILGAQCGAHNSHLELAYTRTAMVYVEVVGLSLKVVQSRNGGRVRGLRHRKLARGDVGNYEAL
ncbi:hypothetical protein PGTUg99_019953 [Puccinia graminis f. sp. tritici]|uniref:Uncharacterized protein n=1 Tax=Puccinia graminis f. sp. tritici TaxID=56615 RepID=A0A5B0RT36_PUCGR|nr:hypothetical protein PGTUg99_019953 [Puccinia graminis f. sp. tritici]